MFKVEFDLLSNKEIEKELSYFINLTKKEKLKLIDEDIDFESVLNEIEKQNHKFEQIKKSAAGKIIIKQVSDILLKNAIGMTNSKFKIVSCLLKENCENEPFDMNVSVTVLPLNSEESEKVITMSLKMLSCFGWQYYLNEKDVINDFTKEMTLEQILRFK